MTCNIRISSKENGFTITELVIVMVIIAMALSVSLARCWSRQTSKRFISRARVDINRNLHNSMMQLKLMYGRQCDGSQWL